MANNPSSNDPSHMQESFQNALRRQSHTASGFDANDVAFFNETNPPVESSNDPSFMKEQFERARRRFGGR